MTGVLASTCFETLPMPSGHADSTLGFGDLSRLDFGNLTGFASAFSAFAPSPHCNTVPASPLRRACLPSNTSIVTADSYQAPFASPWGMDWGILDSSPRVQQVAGSVAIPLHTPAAFENQLPQSGGSKLAAAKEHNEPMFGNLEDMNLESAGLSGPTEPPQEQYNVSAPLECAPGPSRASTKLEENEVQLDGDALDLLVNRVLGQCEQHPQEQQQDAVKKTETSASGASSSSADQADALQSKTPGGKAVMSAIDKKAERRRRNRESSSRCYYNRKRQIEQLDKDLYAEKRKITSLYDIELLLRGENARLKRELVMKGIQLPSRMLKVTARTISPSFPQME